MSKLILVETISQFRHRYAVEIEDDRPVEDAVAFVQAQGAEEMGQVWIGEVVFNSRAIDEQEFFQLFDEDNPYHNGMHVEDKKRAIYKLKD